MKGKTDADLRTELCNNALVLWQRPHIDLLADLAGQVLRAKQEDGGGWVGGKQAGPPRSLLREERLGRRQLTVRTSFFRRRMRTVRASTA